MKVFVTGATGFVGSAVVKELISAGHDVLGLVRSEAGAKAVIEAGAQAHYGDLEDLDSLRKGAEAADGVIHTGFNHDFSKFKLNCEHDQEVIEALGDVLTGSERPLIITSAIGILPRGSMVHEWDRPVAGANPRIASELAADTIAARGVKASVVRLPPSVHGEGDHGFIPILIKIAREKGISVYEGEKGNYWPAVHRLDAARLYRLAVEKAAPAGTRYHSIGEEGILFRQIAETIGRQLKIPVVSKSTEEAAAHFAWFAHFAAMDIRASGAATQEMLDWFPGQPGLIADMEAGHYFKD